MKIYSLFLILFLASCSRKTSIQESFAYTFKEEDLALGVAPIDSITFSYDFVYGNRGSNSEEHISCILKNESSKPFYFHTWSCNGWEYNFNYDTTKFQVFSRIKCLATFSMIKKIPPKSEFYFWSNFYKKDSTSELKDLSYFVYPVSPDFDFHDREKLNKLERVVVKNN